jgi:ketosteroid isomerase-like protein
MSGRATHKFGQAKPSGACRRPAAMMMSRGIKGEGDAMRFSAWYMAVPLALAGLPAGAQTAPDATLLHELLQANRAYIAAAKAGDVAAMRALATEDYLAVDPYHAYVLDDADRFADEQKAWAAYFKADNGAETVVRTEAAAMVKRFSDDVALLAYNELEAVAVPGNRVRGGRSGKCSFVYRRVGGKWLLANSIITEQAWPDRTIMGLRK